MNTSFDTAAAVVHVQTICQLARDARAQRNTAALEFLGQYLKPLMPESALEAFREELKRIPARVVDAPAKPAVDVIADLEKHIATRDGLVHKTPNVNVPPKVMQERVGRMAEKTADIDF